MGAVATLKRRIRDNRNLSLCSVYGGAHSSPTDSVGWDILRDYDEK